SPSFPLLRPQFMPRPGAFHAASSASSASIVVVSFVSSAENSLRTSRSFGCTRPHASPPRILPAEAGDEVDGLGTERRSARSSSTVGPRPPHELAWPAGG